MVFFGQYSCLSPCGPWNIFLSFLPGIISKVKDDVIIINGVVLVSTHDLQFVDPGSISNQGRFYIEEI